MKKILTIALLASAAIPVSAHAAGISVGSSSSTSGSAGASVGGVGVDTNVGADVGVGANSTTRTRSSGQYDTSDDTSTNSAADTSMGTSSSSQIDTAPSLRSDGTTWNDTRGDNTSARAGAAANAASSLSTADIRQIQESLRAQGVYRGSADGIWGPNTARALRDYQQRNNLPVTNSLNDETLGSLGVTLNSSAQGQTSTKNYR